MHVAAFISRRLLLLIPSLLGVSVIVFLLIHLTPGDPTILITGPNVTKEVYERTRSQLGLDRPLPTQYGLFLKRLAQGDLGRSLRFRRPVSELIGSRLPKTLLLGGVGLLVCYAVGVPAGMAVALQRYRVLNVLAAAVPLIGMSVPSFWLGLMLLWLFAAKLGWLPVSGHETWRHLVLPALTLGIGQTAWVARLVRSSMLDVLGQEYVRAAYAKGLRWSRVVVKHALRNALIPLITLFGIQLGWLVAGSVVIEMVFVWPGVGRLLVESILSHDYPVVQAVLLLLAGTIALGNTVADILYRVIDPRISYH